jgi:hypothetical protein
MGFLSFVSESRVLAFVERKTWGYQKEYDPISFTQLERGTGLSRKQVTIATSNLLRRCILIKGTPILVKNQWMNVYWINKDYSEWESFNDKGSVKNYPTKEEDNNKGRVKNYSTLEEGKGRVKKIQKVGLKITPTIIKLQDKKNKIKDNTKSREKSFPLKTNLKKSINEIDKSPLPAKHIQEKVFPEENETEQIVESSYSPSESVGFIEMVKEFESDLNECIEDRDEFYDESEKKKFIKIRNKLREVKSSKDDTRTKKNNIELLKKELDRLL